MNVISGIRDWKKENSRGEKYPKRNTSQKGRKQNIRGMEECTQLREDNERRQWKKEAIRKKKMEGEGGERIIENQYINRM